MTIQGQFIPRNYEVFAGLDVDKKSMAVIFTSHQQLMLSLRLPYERGAVAGICAVVNCAAFMCRRQRIASYVTWCNCATLTSGS